MRFMLLVKANKDIEAGKLPTEQILADLAKFNDELLEAGALIEIAGLQPSSQGARLNSPPDNAPPPVALLPKLGNSLAVTGSSKPILSNEPSPGLGSPRPRNQRSQAGHRYRDPPDLRIRRFPARRSRQPPQSHQGKTHLRQTLACRFSSLSLDLLSEGRESPAGKKAGSRLHLSIQEKVLCDS